MCQWVCAGDPLQTGAECQGAERILLNDSSSRRAWFLPYVNPHEIRGNKSGAKNRSGDLNQELRAVGQGLESLDVEDFDLKAEGDGYFALATRRLPTETRKAGVKKAIRHAWHKLSARDRRDIEERSDVLRVLFTPDGILRLERMGKGHRRANSKGIPNLTKLAQILRVVGERLDARYGRLVKVSKRGDKISIEYASATKQCRKEEWKLSELYDFWLEACKRRQERTDVIEREVKDDRAGR